VWSAEIYAPLSWSPLPRKTTRTKQSIAGRLMSRRSLLIVVVVVVVVVVVLFCCCFCVILYCLFLVFLCLNYALRHRSGS